MKCKIVGFSHMKGYSEKKKKDYDFYSLSVTYQPEKGYVGERVMELTVNPDKVQGIEKIHLPAIAEVVKDVFTNSITVVL